MQGLLDAVVSLAGDLSLSSVLQRIVTTASELVGARYAALGVLQTTDPTAERRLREFVTHGLTPEERAAIGDLPRGHGLLGAIIDNPVPVRLRDIGADDRSHGFPEHHPPMRSFLGVPIRIRETVFGNLYLTEKHNGEEFTSEDERVAVALAAAAGVVIENARLYDEAAGRQRWLEAAAEITTALLGDVGRDEVLQLVADRAREVSGAELSTVAIVDTGSGALVLEVVSGQVDASCVGTVLPRDLGVAAAVMSGGQEVVVVVEPGTAEDREPPLDRDDLSRIMAVPLRARGALVGVLTLAWSRVGADVAAPLDTRLPASFAEQAALALQVASARQDRALLAVYEDRDRIGRDLHDLVIQRLFAIGLTLENASRLSARPEVQTRVTAAVDDIDLTIREIRRTIFELGSGRGVLVDLRSELGSVIEEQAVLLGFRPTWTTEGPVDSAVPDRARPHLLAVLREALSNAARHARASAVEVHLAIGDTVVLTVADDGVGVPDDVTTSGLRNMADRAAELGGTCSVTRGESGGTTVLWTVPVWS
jgi:signal transduction histidine kinase